MVLLPFFSLIFNIKTLHTNSFSKTATQFSRFIPSIEIPINTHIIHLYNISASIIVYLLLIYFDVRTTATADPFSVEKLSNSSSMKG